MRFAKYLVNLNVAANVAVMYATWKSLQICNAKHSHEGFYLEKKEESEC